MKKKTVKELEVENAGLLARIRELEAVGRPLPDVIPPGEYKVLITSVVRKQSKTGRWYWEFVLEVEGSPYAGKRLYWRGLEQVVTPLERFCGDMGMPLERFSNAWNGNNHPGRLAGRTCIALVSISTYQDTKHNVIEELRA